MTSQISKHHNTAVQNKLVAVSQAVAKLGDLELAIISISIGRGQSPVIEVKPGKGCRDLTAAITKYITKGGSRTVEKVAVVGHCQVRWQEIKDRSHA